MKSFCIIFFCLLTTTLCLSSPSTKRVSSSSAAEAAASYSSSSSFSSSDSSILIAGRRPMRGLSISMIDDRYKGRKIKVVKESMRSKIEGDFEGGDDQNDEDADQLVYHVDYHGVTTHPTPTPKHPKP